MSVVATSVVLPGATEPTPVLIFTPEEIANIRGMLRRSNWCCNVTGQMREFLNDSKVIAYLEKQNDEAFLDDSEVTAYLEILEK